MSFKEFQDGHPGWRPSWISERNEFSNFASLCHCDASHQVSAQSDLGLRGYRLNNFKMATMAILNLTEVSLLKAYTFPLTLINISISINDLIRLFKCADWLWIVLSSYGLKRHFTQLIFFERLLASAKYKWRYPRNAAIKKNNLSEKPKKKCSIEAKHTQHMK